MTASLPETPSVLLVDDEPDIRLLARFILEKAGFTIVGEADDGHRALERLRELEAAPTVVLLDNRMPGPTGLEVAEHIRSDDPDQLIVLFSAHLDATVKERARECGIAACVSKMHATQLPEILRGLLPTA
jgi:CheY-like chemotaxis protein